MNEIFSGELLKRLLVLMLERGDSQKKKKEHMPNYQLWLWTIACLLKSLVQIRKGPGCGKLSEPWEYIGQLL